MTRTRSIVILNCIQNSYNFPAWIQSISFFSFLQYLFTLIKLFIIIFSKKVHLLQIKTYKISPRAANAHAYVNAAFKFSLDVNDEYKLLEKPVLMFGGINSKFVGETSIFLRVIY